MTARVAVVIPCYRATAKLSCGGECTRLRSGPKRALQASGDRGERWLPRMLLARSTQRCQRASDTPPEQSRRGRRNALWPSSRSESGVHRDGETDADGQHPPRYLLDLVPYLLEQSPTDLKLVKAAVTAGRAARE